MKLDHPTGKQNIAFALTLQTKSQTLYKFSNLYALFSFSTYLKRASHHQSLHNFSTASQKSELVEVLQSSYIILFFLLTQKGFPPSSTAL